MAERWVRSVALLCLTVLSTTAIAFAVGAGAGITLSWATAADDAQPARPSWVSLPPLRVTSADGLIVNCRMALDVRDADSRAAVQQLLVPLAHVTSLYLASMNDDDLGHPAAAFELSGKVKRRLNTWLAKHGGGQVDSVAVEDLLVRRL